MADGGNFGSSSSSSENAPQSYGGGEAGRRDNFWRRQDGLMNMYNNMMDQMERFHREFNRAFSDSFGDSFSTPRSFFSSPFSSLRGTSNIPLQDQQQNRSTDLSTQQRGGGGDRGRTVDVFSDSLAPRRSFMEDFFSRRPDEFMGWGPGLGGGRSRSIACVPRVDVTDEDSRYVVHADLPGMRREDVKVNVHNGRMNISGGRNGEKKHEGKDYVIQERCNSEFYRSFPLPENIKEDQIKANFNENGTLSVTIPKDEASANKSRRSINIE